MIALVFVISFLSFLRKATDNSTLVPMCLDSFRNASSHGPQARDAPHGSCPSSGSHPQPAGSPSSPACCRQTTVSQCSTGGQPADPRSTGHVHSCTHSACFPSVDSGNQWFCLFVWLQSFYEAQPILDLVFSTALLFYSFLYSTKQTLVCFVLLCHCCGLLLTMLQMGSGVHSSTAAVSSPPLDLQSVSSQPSFPNTPQVRSQNPGMWHLHVASAFRTVPKLFFCEKGR